MSEENNKKLADEIEKLYAVPVIVKIGNMEFKVKSAPFKEIPVVTKMLSDFDNVSENKPVDDEILLAMAKIIRYGIERYHPEWTEEVILKNLPIDCFPDFVDAIIRMNSFFTKMQKMGGGMALLRR
jgi:hypothetical protein